MNGWVLTDKYIRLALIGIDFPQNPQDYSHTS
jgi:hypothetical protein